MTHGYCTLERVQDGLYLYMTLMPNRTVNTLWWPKIFCVNTDDDDDDDVHTYTYTHIHEKTGNRIKDKMFLKEKQSAL